jgi:hypothetical protein
MPGEPGGYEFQVIGDPEGDLFALMQQLIERMRGRLAQRHLTEAWSNGSGPVALQRRRE